MRARRTQPRARGAAAWRGFAVGSVVAAVVAGGLASCERLIPPPLREPRVSSSSPSSLSLAASTGTSGSDGASDANDASARGADEQERLALAMAIRRNLMRDDTLSVAAHNVTVLVHDDTVTLRGLVASARERSVVVAAARQAAPGYRIDDALHVQR